MRRPDHVDPKIAQLLRDAARVPMTAEMRERQLVSFAYGNLKLENESVTRDQVATAVRDQRPRR